MEVFVTAIKFSGSCRCSVESSCNELKNSRVSFVFCIGLPKGRTTSRTSINRNMGIIFIEVLAEKTFKIDGEVRRILD